VIYPALFQCCYPLYSLTQASVAFSWNEDCINAFRTLKQCLTEAPVLVYPSFSSNALELVLQTDASASGLGAVLEQDGHPLHMPVNLLPA